MYRLLIIKRWIEDVFIFPFILTGRIISFFLPPDKEYRVFFFFPFYHIGGAEKVHAQVAMAAGGNDSVIIFTRKSHNNLFYDDFKKSGCRIIDISKYTDNKWLYFLNLVYRGIFSGYINRQQKTPVVFNGQCNFAYKISPWIKDNVKQVELIHSLNTFSYIRIPFLPFITTTVMISKKRIEDHAALYLEKNIPGYFLERIKYIPNSINLPDKNAPDKPSEPFRVLYVGRGGAEKRVPLIASIAKALQETNPEIQFEMLGDVSAAINAEDYPFIKFYGNQAKSAVINAVYEKAHILILTSSTEGFPMVVIEAMAHGCAIICTPVGDLPYHIKNGLNGFLFSSVEDEQQIISEGVHYILQLKNTYPEWQEISYTNIDYANHNFGIENFNEAYRQLLKPKIS